MSMTTEKSCDHCGNGSFTTYYPQTIGWCNACIKEYNLLSIKGILLPGNKKTNFITWRDEATLAILRSIPQKTNEIKLEDYLAEETKEVQPEPVWTTHFCRYEYYGLRDCNCGQCPQAKYASRSFNNNPFGYEKLK
jgi:hypothetical protein